MAGLTVTGGWTIAEAIAEFERAGMPVDPARFRLAVTRVARLERAGEMPSGERGGRGHALYPIGELQRLHAALAPWLTREDHPHDDDEPRLLFHPHARAAR